jgi:putative ABC transport system permease protein
MFDVDIWQEILNTIKKNKLRTFLTGFSVAWGIFMLIILLGAGNGLTNAVATNFQSSKVTSMWIFGGESSKSYKGLKPGRFIQLNNDDYTKVKTSVKGIDLMSSRFQIPGNNIVSYKQRSAPFEIRTVYPDYLVIENIVIKDGRYVNKKDIDETRKVATISTDVRDALFKDKNPIGEYINANGFPFEVVGVFEDKDNWDNNRCIYIPVTTAQKLYGSRNINILSVTVNDNATLEESKQVEKSIRNCIAKTHTFDPTDERAIYIGNSLQDYEQFMKLMASISFFIWIIGIMTIIAGIVGISNIMMIVVKERTKEIGIRKAIGAKPWSIIGLILQESIFITSVAGYIGLVLGIGLLVLINNNMPPSDFFRNPTVSFSLAVEATIILVVAGAIAGFFPANKAAQIKPIEALRDE